MASEEDLAEPGTSSAAASTSQEVRATLVAASEDQNCPVCRNIVADQACRSSCRHCFCFACVAEWTRRRAVCPACKRPLHHAFPEWGAHHEVRIIPRNKKRGRRRPSSGSRRWRRSSGHQHNSSRRDRGGGRGGAPERRRSRSPRWHRDGRRWPQHDWGYDSWRSRRRQRSRAWDAADIPASSGRSKRRHRAGWDSSRQRRATRSRSWRRSRSTGHRVRWEHSRAPRSRERCWNRDTECPCTQERQRNGSCRRGRASHPRQVGTKAHDCSARRRQWRSRDRDEGQAPRPERDVPASSWRSRSWRRSRSTGRRAWRQRQRRRDWDDRRGRSPEWEVHAYPRGPEHHQQRGRDFSRQRRAARSRSRRRSRSRAGRRAW